MTREEAIQILRTQYPHDAVIKEALGLLIPELRESEDERIRTFLLDYAIEMIAGLESDISLSTYDGIKGHDPDAEAELAQWQKARAYLEKQKEQKPAWSEEDEDILNCCISSIEEAKENRYAYKETDGDTSYDREIDWLKSIRPQPKQEWSEEDEEHINSILERLEGMCKKGATFTQTRFAVSEDKDWLKFLHPSWKPNDNQMSMLRAIVNDPNNVGAESCHLAMQSLYNDLLKLK